jgi:hypothetical protein
MVERSPREAPRHYPCLHQVLYAIPPTSILGDPLTDTSAARWHRICDRQSAVQPHAVWTLYRIDGVGGLWLRNRSLRALMPLRR